MDNVWKVGLPSEDGLYLVKTSFRNVPFLCRVQGDYIGDLPEDEGSGIRILEDDILRYIQVPEYDDKKWPETLGYR